MRIVLLIVSLVLFSFFVKSQSFEWVNTFGSTDYDYGNSVITDNTGNVYTVGSFNGTVDFNPGMGTYNLVSQGYTDVFVQKLDASGNFIWAISFGGISSESGSSIKIDATGNIYLMGSFNSSTIDFNPGSGTFFVNSAGPDDIYLLKLDSNGNFIWVKRIGGSSNDSGYSLNFDSSENCYLTGVFRGTVDFDPGTGITNLTSLGNGDVYVLKLDHNGNFIWVKQLGGSMNDEAYESCLDSFGNIYTTGYFQGAADFDPNVGTNTLVSTGITDGFVQKMDANGNLLWVRQIGGTSFDYSLNLCLDDNGNIYTSGYFLGTADFNPGTAIYNLTSAGNADLFIQKMDSSGNFLWAKRIGGAGYDYIKSIDTDQYGNIHATGTFEGTVDFDPNAGTNNLNSSGANDIYLLKLNSAGQFLSVNTIGGVSSDQPNDVFIDNNATIFFTGTFQGTVDMDPTNGVNSKSSNGNDDAFVEKLSQCYTYSVDQITACDSYNWIDGITYLTSNNTATLTVNNGTGCDEVKTLNLTINHSNSSSQILSECDSYTWINGVTYTASTNSPTVILQNIAGCDSIITLNLIILPSTNGVDVQTACDSYTWIDGNTYYNSTNTPTWALTNSLGCDSVVTLNLTLLNNTGLDIQTACDSYTWIDGNTYTSLTTSPTFTFQNVNGCDSVVTLNLTIHNSNTGTDVQTACDSYTWIDGITYTVSTTSPTFTLQNANGCDSIITLDLTIIPTLPLTITNTFSFPSDATTCVGALAVSVSGNADFELNVDNGTQIVNTSGYSLINNLCPGVHDLLVIDNCGDSLTTQFVIPIDSNYVFNNPFIDSIAVDSLGSTITNCDIYYNQIDTAYIDSIWATGNTVNVIWNIVDSNGSNFDTSSYVLNNGNGVYWLQLSVFCPTKALGDYFTVTEAIYFNDGTISMADLAENTFQFDLYPNPTNNEVTLTFDSNEAQVFIYDTKGKLIQTKSIHSGQQISLKEVETGVYFFEVKTEKGRAVKRVVKD